MWHVCFMQQLSSYVALSITKTKKPEAIVLIPALMKTLSCLCTAYSLPLNLDTGLKAGPAYPDLEHVSVWICMVERLDSFDVDKIEF